MRRIMVNFYLLLNLLGLIGGLYLTIASSFFPGAAPGLKILLALGVIEYVLLLPGVWIMARTQSLLQRTYLPILLIYPVSLLTAGLLPEDAESALQVAYLAIAVYCFVERRKNTGHKLGFVPKEFIRQSKKTFKRPLVTIGLMLAGVALIVTISAIRLAAAYVEESGRDALTLHPDGVYTTTMTFEKAGSRVEVIGMVHFADREFYTKTLKAIPRDSLVILEGIKDRQEYLGEGLPHPETQYGLPSQFGIFNPKVKAHFTHLNADIDFGELNDEQRLNEMINVSDGVSRILSESKEERTRSRRLGEDVKQLRNQKLIEAVDRNAANYPTITITWGAGHNEFLEKALLERGYQMLDKREVKAFSFW